MAIPYKTKQVLVLRHKYPNPNGGPRKLRTGKYVAQGAHACMKVFFDRKLTLTAALESRVQFAIELLQTLLGPCLIIPLSPEMDEWVNGTFAKVVLSVKTEEDLMTIYKQAQEAEIPVALIEDVGNTEFHGVTTRTAVALGPAKAEDIDKITMHGTVQTSLM